MARIKYSYNKNGPVKGYVYALKCDNSFYVISKDSYEKAQEKLQIKKPVFLTDLPVYIDSVNI